MAYRFDDEFLNTLRLRCDIETVISKYVQLKKAGSSLVGLCPFHGERTPSFHVNSAKQFFHCFGCDAGGDVISFIMKIENLSYVDAVAYLADQAGIELPAVNTLDNEITSLRKRILEMNRTAARFFYDCLNSPSGAKAMSYFLGRGLSSKTIVHFGLGFAPDGWDNLLKHLISKGYSHEEIKASGLVSVSKDRLFDRFRNRVMFPIFDKRSNIIGFGGRTMGDDPAKYLNTSETLAFKKGNNLYALNFAKNSKDGTLILCEGYMDVIALHQAGFINAVATLGTALTFSQARSMKQMTNEVLICYDSDSAGKTAAKKAIDILSNADIKVRIITITGGKDPDELIKTHGRDAFAKLLETSKNRLDYRIDEIKLKYNINEPNGRADCLKEIVTVLAVINNKVEQEIYVAKVSSEFGISKESIMTEVNVSRRRAAAYKRQQRQRNDIESLKSKKDTVNPEKAKNPKAAKLEEDIISVILNFPEFTDFISDNLNGSDFITDFGSRIFILLIEKIKSNPSEDPLLLILQYLNEDEGGKLTSLVKEDRAFQIDKQKILGIITELRDEKSKSEIKMFSDGGDDTFSSSIENLRNLKNKSGG